MLQHVQLSEQIRPRFTQACCWDVKQPANQPIVLAHPSLRYTVPVAGTFTLNNDNNNNNQGSHFPAVSRISAILKFQNPQKKKKKIRPNLFLKRQLKLTQTASKLQPRADNRILHLVFALRYEISCDQPVAIVF